MTKLLIADDSTTLLATLKLALADEFEVLTATNGKECLNLSLAFKPDLVLTDYDMPEMDGLELIGQLGREPHRPVMVLFSAKLDSALEVQALKQGAKMCLVKPFDIGELKRTLHEALLIGQE